MTLTGIGRSVTSLSIMKMKLDKARDWLRDAEAVLITAGAGMGVDSGLPDFRGNQGFWNAYPAYKRLGFNFVEMASPDRFRDAPELGWGFYGHRLDLYQKTTPHAGFAKLLSYAESKPHGYGVFTSNVDGQFQMAGFSEEHIVECHGSIHHLQCFEGCTEAIWDIGDTSSRGLRGHHASSSAVARVSLLWGLGASKYPHVRRLELDCAKDDRTREAFPPMDEWFIRSSRGGGSSSVRERVFLRYDDFQNTRQVR